MITAPFFLLAALFVGDPAFEGTYTFLVGPVGQDLGYALLEAEVPLPPRDRDAAPLLVRESDGEPVPCQVSRVERKRRARVFWIAPRLKKGAAEKWLFSWKPRGKKPRGGAESVKFRRGKPGHLEVLAGGDLFTRYVFGEGDWKPYLYPIRLDGLDLTRHYPMKKGVPGEREDHPHQRSLWFTHGNVNGVDFWSENSRAGRIVHRKFAAVEGGSVFGVLVARSEWIAPDGPKVLDDRRVYRFILLGEGARAIDVTVTLRASGGPVTFGDTKEGTFGVRVAGSLKETSGGRILNSRGTGGKEAWGKPAEWVDYSGKIGGKTYGIAILDHPSSFRHPTHWHVRGYGLFAANPFGYHDFYRDRSKDGSHRLRKGESATFRYRIVFHRGTTEEARIAEVYRGFASPPAVKVFPGRVD